MDASKRIVYLSFVAGTLIAYWAVSNLYASVFDVLSVRDAHLLGREFTTSKALAAATAIGLVMLFWRHPRWRPAADEVSIELTKVTWPSWDETKTNTRVTVIVSVIIAFILWVFDQVFGALTNWMLGSAT